MNSSTTQAPPVTDIPRAETLAPESATSSQLSSWILSGARRIRGRFLVPALIVVLQAAVTLHKYAETKQGFGARNLEASYHAVLTVKALLSTSFSDHWGLPTVTLGQAQDKWVPWGATVPTATGDYIYTSFPPVGFWLPAVVGYVRGGDIGLAGLVLLNGLLAAVSGVLLYLLVVRAVRRLGRSVLIARGAGMAGAVVYLFTAESLQSHGAVYWPHSLLQPLLLALLLVLDHLLTRDGGAGHRKLLVGLGILTAIACYTEWTAYVFALLSGTAILLFPALRRRIAAAGVVLVVVATVTACVLALHFVLAIGVDSAIASWQQRFAARSGSENTIVDLLYGYALSVGGAVFTVLVVTALAAFQPARLSRWDPVGGALVLFSLTAAVENLVLRQHATEFTFDRLKLAIPLALLAGLAIGHLSRRLFVVAGIIVCIGATIGVVANRADARIYAGWPYVDDANRALVTEAKQEIDFRCATLGTNTQVRGYTNLAFDRAVHEFVQPGKLAALAAQDPGSCGTVYIKAKMAQTDLPQFLSITVLTADGEERVLTR